MSVCGPPSLLVTTRACSHAPAPASPPQLHLRPSGLKVSGARSLGPSQGQLTVGFGLFTDLMGGGAQAVT